MITNENCILAELVSGSIWFLYKFVFWIQLVKTVEASIIMTIFEANRVPPRKGFRKSSKIDVSLIFLICKLILSLKRWELSELSERNIFFNFQPHSSTASDTKCWQSSPPWSTWSFWSITGNYQSFFSYFFTTVCFSKELLNYCEQ